MVNLTDDQIDYILEDIKANGIVLNDLQNNLLDHICCILENEMSEHDDFHSFYKKILPRFFRSELKEIQTETENLLTFKNYYAMKTTLKITGIAAAILSLAGGILKALHLPGAGVSIVLGGFLFSFIFLPLMIILKLRDEESKTDKYVLSFGFLIAMCITIGIIFKIMHWPYANILSLSGLIVFIFVYVPLYFITRYRRAETRFNSTVNAVLMMACSVMLFSLYDLGYSKNNTDNLIRQNNFLTEKINSYEKANSKLIDSKAENTNAKKLHQLTDELMQMINDAKIELISKIENVSREEALKLNIAEFGKGNNAKEVNHLFIQSKETYGFENLKNKLMAYNNYLGEIAPGQTEKLIQIKELELENCLLPTLIQNFVQIQLQLLQNENCILNAL